jgi:hypothetical protein
MRLKPHNKRDGYKVWLSDHELKQLIEELANANQNSSKKRMAGEIGGYCGLRRDEAAQVRPVDVAGTPADPVLRVWEDQAKRDKYRETPMPRDLSHRIRAAETWGGMAPDDSVFGVTGKTLKYSFAEQREADHQWWISDLSKVRNQYPDWELKYGLNEIFEEITRALNKELNGKS